MNFVREALTNAGYSVSTVENGTTPQGPWLSVGIKQYKFNNYTWLAPLIFTWGRIEMDVMLRDASEKVLWQRNYLGKGTSLHITEGFTNSAEKCMTRVLDQMVVDFSSPEFSGAALAVAAK
jgi:hypothetical protein